MKLKEAIASALSRKTIHANCLDIVRHLSVDIGTRAHANHENLVRTRDYIRARFESYGAKPTEQEYTAEGKRVSNIIVDLPGTRKPEKIIIVGAHYDTIEGTPGADDNATAIAGLLELYRLLSAHRLSRTVRFVAFTLEEPPFFSSELMGSMQYAKSCEKRKDPIDFMICLEMLGFGGRNRKQNYPFEDMRKNYPSHGNFLAVVSLPSSSEFAYLWRNTWNRYCGRKKIYDMIGPSSVPGISFSDHYSFNRHGFKSIMLTDTAFFRNTNYHTENDTIDTLNFRFLSYNIWYMYLTMLDIANRETMPNETDPQA